MAAASADVPVTPGDIVTLRTPSVVKVLPATMKGEAPESFRAFMSTPCARRLYWPTD